MRDTVMCKLKWKIYDGKCWCGVSSLHCQSILIECAWKKNQTHINEIALLLWPQSVGYKWSCVEKCVSFRMNGKAKVKTTITATGNGNDNDNNRSQQCDAIVNRSYYYFGMEVGCIEVYAWWMTHLAICYITLFHDVTTSQPASMFLLRMLMLSRSFSLSPSVCACLCVASLVNSCCV